MEEHHTVSQWIGNIVSGGALVTSWVGIMPTIMTLLASGIALVWYLIQIYESETVRRWLLNRRKRKIAYLRARAAGLEAYDRQLPPEA
jgi:hypothetical protein